MKKIKVTVNRDNSGAHLYDLELVALPPVGTVLFAPSPFRPDDSFPPRYFIVKEVIVDLVADPSGRRAIMFVEPKERKLDWAGEERNDTSSSEDEIASPAPDEQSEGESNPGIKCLVTDVGGSFREIFYFQTVPGVGEHLTLGVSKPGEPTIRGGYTVVEVNHHAESNKAEHIVYINIEKYSLGGI